MTNRLDPSITSAVCMVDYPRSINTFTPVPDDDDFYRFPALINEFEQAPKKKRAKRAITHLLAVHQAYLDGQNSITDVPTRVQLAFDDQLKVKSWFARRYANASKPWLFVADLGRGEHLLLTAPDSVTTAAEFEKWALGEATDEAGMRYMERWMERHLTRGNHIWTVTAVAGPQDVARHLRKTGRL